MDRLDPDGGRRFSNGRRWFYPTGAWKWLVSGAITAVVGLVAYKTVPVQNNIVYERFREANTAHRIAHIVNAPVPYSAYDYVPEQSLQTNLAPSSDSQNWGTDKNAGDVLSRLLHACRIASSIGLIATGLSLIIGIVIGTAMGYFAGLVDMLGMRVMEVFQAIPTLFLMIALVAFFPDESYRLPMLMVIIGVTGWTGYARYLRAEVLRLRQQDSSMPPSLSGLPLQRVLFRHILPNAVGPLVIAASFGIRRGHHVRKHPQLPRSRCYRPAQLGGMLEQSLGDAGDFHWWLAFFPGIAIFITVFAWNLLGEALGDALDPKRL